MNLVRAHVMVCCGTGCSSSDSPRIAAAFEEQLKAAGLEQEIKLVRTGCFGLCAAGPIVMVFPDGTDRKSVV